MKIAGVYFPKRVCALLEKWAAEEEYDSPTVLIQEIVTRAVYEKYPLNPTVGNDLETHGDGVVGNEPQVLRNS